MNTREIIKDGLNHIFQELEGMPDGEEKTTLKNQLFLLEQYSNKMFIIAKEVQKLKINLDTLPDNHLFIENQMYLDTKKAIDDFILKLNIYL